MYLTNLPSSLWDCVGVDLRSAPASDATLMYRRSLRLSLRSYATGPGIPGSMDASLKKALLNNELLNKALCNKAPRHFYHPLNPLAEVKGFTYGS